MNLHNPNLSLIEMVARELRPFLEEDEDAFWDSLDGETDAVEIVDTLLASMREDATLAAAIRERETSLLRRRQRIEHRAAGKKRVIGRILRAANVKKMERPEATVSVRDGNLSVAITDEKDVPSQLCRVVTTTSPDKVAIKKQLQAGERVPGAEMVRGDDIVTVGVK